MDLSIVVTHYCQTELLSQCLASLKKNLKDISYEIIVVLSKCQPKILEELKQDYPLVKFLPFEENLYFVRSANRGLKQAQGDFILIINDDVIIAEGSVQRLLDFLRKNSEVGLVGPKVLYPDGAKQSTCFRFYTPLTIVCRRTILGKIGFCQRSIGRFLYANKNLDQKQEVDWLMNGAGVLTKKEYLNKVGLLDERFRHYFSDVDWCRRFWQKGFRVVYFPGAVFFHHHARSSKGRGIISLLTNEMTRIHVWDGLKYFWKWGLRDSNIRMHTNDTNNRIRIISIN